MSRGAVQKAPGIPCWGARRGIHWSGEGWYETVIYEDAGCGQRLYLPRLPDAGPAAPRGRTGAPAVPAACFGGGRRADLHCAAPSGRRGRQRWSCTTRTAAPAPCAATACAVWRNTCMSTACKKTASNWIPAARDARRCTVWGRICGGRGWDGFPPGRRMCPWRGSAQGRFRICRWWPEAANGRSSA